MRFPTFNPMAAVKDWWGTVHDWWVCNVWFFINHTISLDSYTRLKHRFLLWPKPVGGETRWLERAWWRERRFSTSTGGHYRWRAEKWSDCFGN